ncbi:MULTISPECIES: endonuclease/exonuclease/phosphatase family protein [Flavobacteriaceae]|uniref:Endonuclease/exonuclease/phosphatase family protein n=2 Tax=Flavobacteriaceae TaxID=49546 RepID=A0A4Y8ARR0_9FLAO|nr:MULTISPECIES: endonuclease/exonuclease/phosphatase family protein [Flavobacteriaceae]TEW73067.1 endonuclease/exonuclease/phosphatase family protein [Gramella jeungdoensis]GGK47289.1 endonuclease [Lutibacter litoralis]
MKKISYLLVLVVLVSCSSEIENLNIMTYNIRYDNPNDGENQWSKRKEFLSNQIAFNEVDIFGIQEGLQHQVTYLDSVFVDYNYIGIGRDDGKTKGEYSAIFYNSKKFKVIESNTFWLSDTPNEISVGWDASMERICTYGLFETIETKRPFFVFNTHFDHIGTKARLNSAKLILQKIAEFNSNNLPVLVLGDFNLTPETAPIQQLSKELNDSKIVSRLEPFGPTGTFNGFKFNEPVIARIDYIFTSKNNMSVEKYAVLSDSKDCKYPSDHLPVIIEIKIK